MSNPVLCGDFPEPDVIRVNDTYYMISTTRHFMPGGELMRSYDLVHWEVAGYLYDSLNNSAQEKMQGEQSMYGLGMEHGCLRYHQGKFYAIFRPRDREYKKLCIFESENIRGPWKRWEIEGDYYNPSVLFDDDGKVYLVFGYESIYVAELNPDLSGFMDDGFFRKIYSETIDGYMQLSGCHAYKKDGTYYFFVSNWPHGEPAIRTQYCLMSDSLNGEFVSHKVFCTEGNAKGQGIANGGIVDTPDGDWYAILSQDRGAIGALPVLVPVKFEGKVPVFGNDGKFVEQVQIHSNRPFYTYDPYVCSDSFEYSLEEGDHGLKRQWQWNHFPDSDLWWIAKSGGLCIRTGKITTNLVQARNTLVQRCVYPQSSVEVTVDGNELNNGDYAGLCCLEGCYGFIGITKDVNQYYLVNVLRELQDSPVNDILPDYMPGTIVERIPLASSKVTVSISANFENMKDIATFFYEVDGRFEQVGKKHRLCYKIDHYVGCRFGLSVYATKAVGGFARFENFRYYS